MLYIIWWLFLILVNISQCIRIIFEEISCSSLFPSLQIFLIFSIILFIIYMIFKSFCHITFIIILFYTWYLFCWYSNWVIWIIEYSDIRDFIIFCKQIIYHFLFFESERRNKILSLINTSQWYENNMYKWTKKFELK